MTLDELQTWRRELWAALSDLEAHIAALDGRRAARRVRAWCAKGL